MLSLKLILLEIGIEKNATSSMFSIILLNTIVVLKHKKSIKRKKPTESSGFFCERRRIRTFDRLLRRQVLYPAELCVH
jgi:hypothetical protein